MSHFLVFAFAQAQGLLKMRPWALPAECPQFKQSKHGQKSSWVLGSETSIQEFWPIRCRGNWLTQVQTKEVPLEGLQFYDMGTPWQCGFQTDLAMNLRNREQPNNLGDFFKLRKSTLDISRVMMAALLYYLRFWKF